MTLNEPRPCHARRILQERGFDCDVLLALSNIGTKGPNVPVRLRGLWAMHVTRRQGMNVGPGALDDADENLRAWGVQLTCEDPPTSKRTLNRLVEMAATDPSPLVCLYLASAASRLDDQRRWRIIEALAARESLAEDQNLPLMTWYALEPVVKSDPARALKLATSSKFPKLREYVARRIASGD